MNITPEQNAADFLAAISGASTPASREYARTALDLARCISMRTLVESPDATYRENARRFLAALTPKGSP